MGYKFNPFTGNLDIAGTAAIDTTLNGTAGLTARAAWNNRASAPMNIVVIGDSVTTGYYATSAENRWTSVMYDRLCQMAGQITAPMYYPIDWSGNTLTGYTGRLWTKTGTPVYNTDSGLALSNVSIPNGATVTSPTVVCDRLWVTYPTFNTFVGTLDVYIDGVFQTTITINTGTAAGTRIWDSGALTRGPHYVTLQPHTAVTTRAEGVVFFDGNGGSSYTNGSGIRMYSAGHFGYSTTQFSASASSAWWTDGLETLGADLVAIFLGINDQGSAMAASTYQTNLTTIVDRIRTVTSGLGEPDPSILIIAPFGTGADDDASTPYQIAAEAVAKANGCAFVNLEELMGYVGTSTADVYSYMSASDPANSKKHPNDSGHKVIGEAIADFMIEAFNGDPTWGIDSPGIRTTKHIAIGNQADVDTTGPVNSYLQALLGVGTLQAVESIQETMTSTPQTYNFGMVMKPVFNFSSAPTVSAAYEFTTTMQGSTNPTYALGGIGSVNHAGSGTLTGAYGFYLGTNLNTGGGTVTTSYGLYLAAQSYGSTNYNMYSQGLGSRNYFEGYVETASTGGFYLGTTGTVNSRFLINTPLVADATAEQQTTPSSTARKGLVIQARSSHTANLFELQDNTGAAMAAFNPSGYLLFGSSGDTNLYRSAADTLKTDDAFEVGSTITMPNNTNFRWKDSSGTIKNVLNLNASNNVTINSGATTGNDILFMPRGVEAARFDQSASSLLFADAINLEFNTTTGTKIGTSATQKIGFWNATPVVQSTGWSVSNVTTDKTYDANATTINELADVLGTLIEQLKTYGILGA